MNLYNELAKRYENNSAFNTELSNQGINILQGYQNNKSNIEKFYEHFYKNNYPKIILCGINPGRLGAGKTGIPFIDFDTLREIFITIFGISGFPSESERSAQFIKYVIENFEGRYASFFNNVYLTNFSFLGYTKENKNINYYELPCHLKKFIEEMFIYEMDIIRPKVIIPLSVDVANSLSKIEKFKNLTIAERLPHPYWCSFEKRKEEQMIKYLNRIKNYY